MRGAGGEACPQTMARKAGSVDAGGGDALFDDKRYGFGGKPLGGDAAVAVDRSEDGAVVDPGDGNPMVESDDRAVPGSAEGYADLAPCSFLVTFRAAQRDDQPLPGALDVGVIEADQLRPSHVRLTPRNIARVEPNLASLKKLALAA